MKLNKSFVLVPLFMFLFSSTVFAVEPVEINPELLQFEPMEPMMYEQMQFEEPAYSDDPYIDDSSIYTELRGQLNEDGSVFIDWRIYDKLDFLWYKILRSQENKELLYPRDGYVEFYEDPFRNYYDDTYVPVGSNFYRVCIITKDNRRGCSNQIEIVKEKPVKPDFIEEKIEPKPEEFEKPENPRIENPRDIQAEKDDTKGTLINGILRFISNNIEIIIAILALILGITGYSFATKRKQRSISKYMTQIDNTYSEFKMKSKRCEAELYRLRDIVDEELKTGKLDDGAYQLLMNRIEGYMVEIQKQIVNEKFGGLPENLKNELFNMMENGEISEKEYEKFQTLINKSKLSGNEQSTLLKTVKDFQVQGEKLKRKGPKDD